MKSYNDVLNFINTYKPNTYVYQRVVKRHFGLDGNTVHAILEKMVVDGVLERAFTTICSKCNYSNTVVYSRLNQLSDEDLICHKCGSDLSVLEDITMFYKKI